MKTEEEISKMIMDILDEKKVVYKQRWAKRAHLEALLWVLGVKLRNAKDFKNIYNLNKACEKMELEEYWE